MPRAASRTAGIDSGDSGGGVANDRQQRVERQRGDGEPVSALAQPRSRQQKSKQREARNCLRDVGAAKDRFREPWPARHQNSQRHADGDREQHGRAAPARCARASPAEFRRRAARKIAIAFIGPSQIRSKVAQLRDVCGRDGLARVQKFAAANKVPSALRSPSEPMRVPSSNASLVSCVTMTMVFLSRCCSARNSRRISTRVSGSSAPNGSSISRIGGSAASARATPTRCRWPPESSCG